MKKLISLFVAVIFCLVSLPAKAVSYRGFVEANVGCTTIKHQVSYGFETTHGIQVYKSIFIGVGAGLEFGHQDLYKIVDDVKFQRKGEPGLVKLNFYGNIRWDGFGIFGAGKKISPFGDIKAGWQTDIDGLNYYIKNNFNGKHTVEGHFSKFTGSGFFLRPTIGIRIRCSSIVGLSLGIYYDLIDNLKFKSKESEEYGTIPAVNWSFHPVGFSLGLDF